MAVPPGHWIGGDPTPNFALSTYRLPTADGTDGGVSGGSFGGQRQYALPSQSDSTYPPAFTDAASLIGAHLQQYGPGEQAFVAALGSMPWLTTELSGMHLDQLKDFAFTGVPPAGVWGADGRV